MWSRFSIRFSASFALVNERPLKVPKACLFSAKGAMSPNERLLKVPKACLFSAKGAMSPEAWGIAPGIVECKSASAESAIQVQALVLNPKHNVRRNPRHACAITPGIPPETSACDGALVAYVRIAVRHRADSGSLKTRHIRAARKSRDSER